MWTIAADLVRVGTGGLVAVVPVGDQQLGVGQLGGNRLVDSGIGDPPDAMNGAVGVGDLAPWLGAQIGPDVAPHVSGVKREDRRQVVAGGLGEPQSVLLGAGLGALVGANESSAVLGDAYPGEEPVPRAPAAIGPLEVLSERPDRWFAVG